MILLFISIIRDVFKNIQQAHENISLIILIVLLEL